MMDSKNRILDALKHFENGASPQELFSFLDGLIPKRSLQRQLATLLKEGMIVASGSTRAIRYFLAKIKEQVEESIPLSSTAKKILSDLQCPLVKRTPVGYNRHFLEIYRPNETFYLSENHRQHLLSLGKSDGERPAGTYARQIFNRLLIDLAWNSSRLEGNTYSLLETARLLEVGKAVEGKDLKEAQMILNHKEAIEFLIEGALQIDMNRYTILNLHALLSNNLMHDPRACGTLRLKPVGISLSTYHPLEIPSLIADCFEILLKKSTQIVDPFEQAFFMMVHLPYLQPFEDVNKRVSRLAANIPFIKHNLAPLSFVDVPEKIYISALLAVYELNNIDLLRDVFIWAYERSCTLYTITKESLGEPDPFRLRYRELIYTAITTIVKEKMNASSAVAEIRKQASHYLPLKDHAYFLQVVENELLSLHEGNIARYRLSPSQYRAWIDNPN